MEQEWALPLQFVDVRRSSFVSANGSRVCREKDVVLSREKDTSQPAANIILHHQCYHQRIQLNSKYVARSSCSQHFIVFLVEQQEYVFYFTSRYGQPKEQLNLYNYLICCLQCTPDIYLFVVYGTTFPGSKILQVYPHQVKQEWDILSI